MTEDVHTEAPHAEEREFLLRSLDDLDAERAAGNIDDETYAAALGSFGRDGVLDMVHLIGMYLATSALLNAFEVPAPEIPPAP